VPRLSDSLEANRDKLTGRVSPVGTLQRLLMTLPQDDAQKLKELLMDKSLATNRVATFLHQFGKQVEAEIPKLKGDQVAQQSNLAALCGRVSYQMVQSYRTKHHSQES